MKLAKLWPFSRPQAGSSPKLQKGPPVCLCSFANDNDYRLKLPEEDRAIREALNDLDRRQEIRHLPIGQTNLDDLYNTFNKYHNQIYIFHYGGHSNCESLHLDGKNTRSQSLAKLLGQQPLKLVFLNGCANKQQVKDLFKVGVPVVIATSAKVKDDTSRQLAQQFYKSLAGGKTIRQAFNAAVSYVEQNNEQHEEIADRGLSLRGNQDGVFPWGLYYKSQNALKWKISDARSTENVSDENLRKIRAGLLESYQGRLKSKLAARFPINLELKYSTEGTTTKADIYDNRTIRSTKIKEELIELFDKHRGRLLIIGEPGAGKTTLLLQLAERLMEREERQIPVVINIATWRERFTSVEEWLQELLPQMGFSKALATQFLEDDLMLPFFDGLDELDEDLRKPCLEAIGEYGRNQEVRYVICSRIVEYAQTVDAPVRCQIMVKPLTITQIKAGLQEADSPETNGILDAMDKDPLLKEAIKTPFYLNTVQLLFAASKVWEEFGFKAETLEGRQQEIVEFFVADASGGFEKYSSDQVKKYLGFLADRMTWKGLVEFELVDLQYDWEGFEKVQMIRAKVLEGLVYGINRGMVYGVVVGFFVGLVYGLRKNLILGFVYTLVGGLIGGIVYGLMQGLIGGIVRGLGGKLFFDPILGLSRGLLKGLARNEEVKTVKIKTSDIINWSPKILKDYLKKYLVKGLAFGVILGLMAGLVDFVVNGQIDELVISLFFILVGVGFGYSLIIGLVAGLVAQLEKNQSYLKVNRPYQRFKSSIGVLHFSIIQHLHLRRLLYQKRLLPKKLAFFLKETTSYYFLESDGGSWRFRHRILQEYFAGHWAAVYGSEFPRDDDEKAKPA